MSLGTGTAVLALALASCAPAQASGPDGGAVIAPDGTFTRFNHKVHVTENLIGCGTCHPYARHSAVAGLASLATCMGCHKFAGKEKPAIQAIQALAEAGKPLEFTRVFRQPDHVYFSHERHLLRAVQCSECHGDVAHMANDGQVKDMHMGFCIECHNARQANVDCITCHK
jgi:hypothetical protein